MEKRNVTVYDIAKEANVSPATVSRVLTGNARVSEEKRKSVEEIIEKYNFQPNAIARSLFKKQTKIIGFVLPDITNPFFSTVYLGIEKYAVNAGYTMMLCDSMSSHELEFTHLRTLAEKQVDAIVFMGGRVNEVKTNPKYADEMNQILARTPIVIVNGKMTGVDCYKIVTDEEKGIAQLVDYLVSLGHREIGILGGTSNVTATKIKHEAFAKALSKHKIEVNKRWIITKGFSMESGYECMRRLLMMKERPTAVLTISDFVAIGAIRAAKEAGLRVPQDISITGFDGTYISEIIDPHLTTVSQNYNAIGKAIIETIDEIVDGKMPQKEKIIDTSLIVRDSCCERTT